MKFTKMHGIGNDYIYINCFEEKIENPNELAIKLSDRHFGIGGDGIVLILHSSRADFEMQMFNSDGSEAEMCGNAIRCVGKYVYDEKMISSNKVMIDTKSGIKEVKFTFEGEDIKLITVDMGEPMIGCKDIPVVSESERFVNESVWIDGTEYKTTCVSTGNPHAVTYMDNIDSLDIKSIGPKFENNKLFPNRINTEFVEVVNDKELKMRVWERGAGETLACGTGACAVLVASYLNGVSQREATIKLLGGELIIKWDKVTNHIFMTGTATKVFSGYINITE